MTTVNKGAWLLALTLISAAAWAAPVKVAVYQRALGAASVIKALKEDKTLQVTGVKDLKLDTLLAHDVLILGGFSVDKHEDVRAIQTYAACGGGVVFNHSSCGRRKPATLFPSVAKKVVDRREDTIVVVKDPAHPLAAGVGKEFEHAFMDHLFLEPGENGVVVVEDRQGAPVVVAGAAGLGRVVFNGFLPGYWFDAATYWQGERPPEGGELRILANAARWAGQGRVSSVPAAQVAERRQKAEQEMKLDDLSKLLPTSDWFGSEMLRGSYLPMRPVTELGGRYFITYDGQTWRGYGAARVKDEGGVEFYRRRTEADVRQLKWLGVTDIIFWTDVSGNRLYRDASDVPDMSPQARGIDPLAELIKAATPEGVNVWASWHSCAKVSDGEASKKWAEKYGAKDGKGGYHLTNSNRDYCEDLLSPAYPERCRRILDEYAAKYKPMGRFMGLAVYDELWFTYADFHGDDAEAYAKFCKERFGETPPPEALAMLGRIRDWKDPADVWRRRYLLFKQNVVTSFWKGLVDHAHAKGLQIGVELLGTAQFASGWCWGMESVALSRLGADFYVATSAQSPCSAFPNTMRWAHAYAPWGYYNTHCLRGGPGGVYFTFSQLWRPLMYGNNIHLPREFARHVHNQRQWAGAQPLAAVAILHNQNALQMLMDDPRPRVTRENSVLTAIEAEQDVDIIFVQAHELYGRYRALLAPPLSGRGLSQEVCARLRQFVEQGGVLISADCDWSVSRPDLTQERFVTAEMSGVTYGEPAPPAPATLTWDGVEIKLSKDTPRRPAKLADGAKTLAAFSDGAPAITEMALGKGRVIAVHFDLGAEIEKGENAALASQLRKLAREASRPAVAAQGQDSRVISALKKGNWVAVALYPTKMPAKLRLSVDTQALGVAKTHFRVLMLGKAMEIAKPGDMWGDDGFWTPKELKAGLDVTIVADNESNMPLPEKFDFSDFKGKRGEEHAQYIENIARSWWNSETRGKRKRDYAHEIVVLAPADEAWPPKE